MWIRGFEDLKILIRMHIESFEPLILWFVNHIIRQALIIWIKKSSFFFLYGKGFSWGPLGHTLQSWVFWASSVLKISPMVKWPRNSFIDSTTLHKLLPLVLLKNLPVRFTKPTERHTKGTRCINISLSSRVFKTLGPNIVIGFHKKKISRKTVTSVDACKITIFISGWCYKIICKWNSFVGDQYMINFITVMTAEIGLKTAKTGWLNL